MTEASGEHWHAIADKYWLKTTPTSVDSEVLRSQLWTPIETQGFALDSLLQLEDLQVVERYLWPTYTADSPNQQVILLAAFINFKWQRNLISWPIFETKPSEFSSLFHRILSLLIDSSLGASSRLVLLEFVIGAFQSLEKDFVRKECAPLVSIAIWHNLHDEEFRQKKLSEQAARQKAWRSVKRRFEAADKTSQVRLQFERAWLYSMVLQFLQAYQSDQAISVDGLTYCGRFLEFMIDLISQLPTRRYAITLFRDLNVVPILKTSNGLNGTADTLLHDLIDLYQHFSGLEVDDPGSAILNNTGCRIKHHEALAHLQRVAYENFEDKLKVLALSNYASIDQPDELNSHLSLLTDAELERLCQLLGFRTSYPPSVRIKTGRSLFLQILISGYASPSVAHRATKQLLALPTEESLYDPRLLRNEFYDGAKPLAVPKLNLQYLSLDDFMWRSFKLYQAEAFYEIRQDMENVLKRMKPRAGRDPKTTIFEGFSKMAIPIDKPSIIDIGPPKVGSNVPSYVRAEVSVDVSRLSDRIRSEWDQLRPRDVVFLLAATGTTSNGQTVNGKTGPVQNQDRLLQRIRTAEVVQMLDESGKALRNQSTGYGRRPTKRRLLVDLDPIAFNADQRRLNKTKEDVISSLNVLVRRHARENNFKPVLETIQSLVGAKAELPAWYQDIFLGFGDPKSASYPNSPSTIPRLDFLDTFLDSNHLKESFPARHCEFPQTSAPLEPPFVLELRSNKSQVASTNPRKRRREQIEEDDAPSASIYVSAYESINTGPYPSDLPRKNTIRFTPKQVEAIVSGTQPGLTVIVGPPGTGKTDVATQIINVLYHNFPSDRILLVAHSNQALNQLFQKITALDIDPRHLLRLGHGEGELEAEASYSKYGRVEYFMENRQSYLSEVQRLATSIGAQGAHGNSCETADYFNQVFIRPAWSKFWRVADADAATVESITTAFPFFRYFANAPVPELFPPSVTVSQARQVARGCQYHLDRVFQELEIIRPFEILRSPRDQANHLLVKEARIVAMTTTHAAMRRAEIADLGFHYDTVIMEEAAQVTEIESFIPCAMQNADAKTGKIPVKRIVLVGDHLQNSPVIQNLALRQYANFEQSLFLRLIRLGVPAISLDQQGRCRPSIAELFNWRYENLTNLPHLASLPAFTRANAGFRHEYQFIDVPDYQGQGEREPTAHFIQNLGEAEYAVALYQYMRLLGYPAKSISVLTTYAGQKALIQDVLEHRCKGNLLFGSPKIVTTVDKYQGEQNDYVILSLVRTKSVGYLRDVRRLTVALSRARLGLYALGRKELFASCPEMQIAMHRLTSRGGEKLELVTDEMFPTDRALDADAVSVEMDGVEHLGQYVYEMTQAKIKSMGGNFVLEGGDEAVDGEVGAEGAIQEAAEEADLEEDPLHERT